MTLKVNYEIMFNDRQTKEKRLNREERNWLGDIFLTIATLGVTFIAYKTLVELLLNI